jgi:uncharacterized lipoprotein YajG
MKTKLIKRILMLVGAGALLAGCATTNQQSMNFDLDYPPGPPMSASSQ